MRSVAARSPASLSIGELSRRSGVHIETIRYYERIRMLPAPPRTASGRRVYGPAETRSLAFIRAPANSASPSRKFAPCWPFPPTTAKTPAPRCASLRPVILRMSGRRLPIYALWQVCCRMPCADAMPVSCQDVR
jgi:hypothetical protein